MHISAVIRDSYNHRDGVRFGVQDETDKNHTSLINVYRLDGNGSRALVSKAHKFLNNSLCSTWFRLLADGTLGSIDRLEREPMPVERISQFIEYFLKEFETFNVNI